MVEKLIGEQFKGKDKLITAELRGAAHGPRLRRASISTARSASGCARADAVGDRIFIDGNDAAGARRGLWRRHGRGLVSDHARRPRWPRPSRKHCRALPRRSRRPGRSRYAIVQAEDELASIGMVIGAAWNGARAFTATSGPGISLMQEFIGLAYFAEIPAVIFDVQRGGPSTGMPTRTQQSDILDLGLCLARRHQARAAVPRGPARVLRVRGRRPSTSPTGCRRRSSSCSTSTSA